MKFSIVIPVYNVAPYLRECLDSVLAQTFTDWEAICVDDGSTDLSGSILVEYAAKDSRLRVIYQDKKGVSAARNAALEVARGEWVWFIDADGAIHPDALSWLSDVFSANPTYGAFGINYGNLHGDCVVNDWPVLSTIEDVRRINDVCYESLLLCRMSVWGVIVRKDKIGDTRFCDYLLGADELFNFTVFWKDVRTLSLEVPIYFKRSNSSSLWDSQCGFRKVSDSLETEIALLSMMIAHRDLWKPECVVDYFHKIKDLIFCTDNSRLWSLSLQEISQLLGRWTTLQRLFQELFQGVPLYRKFLFHVACFIPSAWLCRSLYRVPKRLRGSQWGMLRRYFARKKVTRLGVTYNLFDGEELLRSSVLSIRSVASYVNVVYQDVSNSGVRRLRSVRRYLESLKTEGLIDELIEYSPDLSLDRAWNEKRKRVIGMIACKQNRCTHFMSMDVDEFYRAAEVDQAINFMRVNDIDYAAVSIIEYLREPTWRLVSNYMFPPKNENYVFYVPFVIRIPHKVDLHIFPCRVDPTRGFATGRRFYLFPKDVIAMHHMSHVRTNYALKCKNSTSARCSAYVDATAAVLKYEFKRGSCAPEGYDFIGNYLVKEVADEFCVKSCLRRGNA